jgi:hypothetical protein
MSSTSVVAFTPILIPLSHQLPKVIETMSIEVEHTCVSTTGINEKLEVVLTKETRVLEINTREM